MPCLFFTPVQRKQLRPFLDFLHHICPLFGCIIALAKRHTDVVKEFVWRKGDHGKHYALLLFPLLTL